jgi:HEAT repeat protein
LAKGRAQRFAPGDLLLVAIEPLPPGSLWDERFPGARAGGGVVAVAARGDAYLRHPTQADVDLLATYLALPAEQRDKTAGVTALSRAIAEASPGLAVSALARLESVGDIEARLDAESVRWLEQSMLDRERPAALRRDLVRIAGDRKIAKLRRALERLAEPDGDLQPQALAAVAVLAGGFERRRLDELLASPAPELRAVGARFARSPELRARLAGLVAEDPSPPVRAAAATSLLSVAGLEAFKEVVPALADTEPSVRLAAVEAVRGLGEEAVLPLAELVRGGTVEEATGAVLALDQIGGAGKAVLLETATQHPDERIRHLAQLALGRMPGHEH